VIDAFAGLDAAEVFITSSAHMVAALPPEDAHTDDDHPDMGVTIALADGDKCDRCWKILPELLHGDHHLCGRCHDVISG
jgi:isoleucyl-tRNA synthetase